MENKYDKALVSRDALQCVSTQNNQKPHLCFFKNSQDEASWIVDKIMEYKKEGISLSNQAILFRSAYISIPLQTELSKRDIYYKVYGGMRFYETAHVKDVFSHLKLFVNPIDELAWRRVLLLLEGIGPKTAMVLKEHGFDTVEKISKISAEELSQVPGIGKATAEKVISNAKAFLKTGGSK